MANASVTGTVIVRVDGSSIRSKTGAKLEMGGAERIAVYADGELMGFASKPVGSKVTCTLAHTANLSLSDLRDITDSSMTFECDTGVKFSLRGMFMTKPPELTGGEGDVAVEFMGQPAVEM